MTVTQAIWRSGVVVALVALTVTLCDLFPNAATDPETGMVMKLPESIPGHQSISWPISEEEEKWLPADTGYLKMGYFPKDALSREDAFQRGLFATLILSGNDRRSLHRPEVCLDGQGWEIWKREVVKVDIGGRPLEVMDFHLRKMQPQRDGTLVEVRSQYFYWWVGKNSSTASDFERILISVLDNMFRNTNNRWGYPSVMVNVDLERGEQGEKDARQRAIEFIQEYAPMFQKAFGAVEDEA